MLKRLGFLVLLLCGIAAGVFGARRFLAPGELPLDRARALLAAKRPAAAQAVARGIVRVDPRAVEAHLVLAQTQLLLADWLSAEKEARALRTLRYDRMVVNAMLARALVMQEHYQDVLTEIPAVASRPEEQALNLALRSRAYLAMGDVVQAQSSLDGAVQQRADEPAVLVQQARMALSRRDFASALARVAGALRTRPNDVETILLESEILAAEGKTAEGVQALDQAVEIAPSSPQVRLARAALLMETGSDARAQGDVDAVFDVSPHDPTASFDNAVLLFRKKQYADAGVEFDKLAAALDRYPAGYLYKARIAMEFGNKQSALDSLDRLLKVRPNDSEGLRLAVLLDLQTQQPMQAVALLKTATAAAPRDGLNFDLLGRAYFMLGRREEAIESFGRAAALAPESKEFAAHLVAAKTEFGVAPLPMEPAVGEPVVEEAR